jgi:hypothetical protein
MDETEHARLKALLNDFGVEYEERTANNGILTIILEEGAAKVTGYVGFRAEFDFTEEGRFVEVGVYE